MRSVQSLVLALLATAPCFQSLCLADTVEICNATASANGNTFSIPCTPFNVPPPFASITATDGALYVNLLDYADGYVSTSVPGAEVSFSLDWEASASGEFEVSGGSGDGELVLTGGSESYSNGFQELSGDFLSNFLPDPRPYAFGPSVIDVPFTFGVPFDLYMHAIITGEGGGPPYFVYWDAALHWDLNSTEILDSNANPVAGASISSVSVPEPSTIAMALLMLAALATQLWLRNTSRKKL